MLVTVGCEQDPQGPDPLPESTAPALATTSTALLSFRQVSAGTHHSCGVATDDRAYCWGSNSRGQLGDGSMATQRERPVLVLGGLRFRQVSAGSHHTCAVTTDYRAYCWGWNYKGALGDGTDRVLARRPVAVAGDWRFRDVSAGQFFTCAVARSDRAFCWGWNHIGQVGDGTTIEQRHTPRRVAGGLSFRMVSAGTEHACGVTLADAAYCWGSNEYGSVGDGTTTTVRRVPAAVAGGRSFSQVAAGDRSSCGVTTARSAYCWGWNLYGQVGDGTRIDRRAPRAVAGGLAFHAVSVGGAHTCGLRTDQAISCWGHNSFGQLGNGTTADYTIPVPLYGNFQYRQVDAGSSHNCGVTTNNRAYCWGYGGFGQRGDGTATATHPWPALVVGPS